MKNYKFLVPIALVLVFAASIYMKINSNVEKQRIYEEALEAARNARGMEVWVDAEAYYKEALQYSDYPELWVELGEMYVEANMGRKAISWGEDAVSAYPKEPCVYEYLAFVYAQYGEYTACFQLCDKAEKLGIVSESLSATMASIEYVYNETGQYENVGVYSGGYCPVQTNSYWGYTALTGNQTIRAQFVYAGPFASGVAPVIDQDGEAYFIDAEGNKKIAIPNLEKIEILGLMENDIFSAYDGTNWNFYTKNGEILFGGYEDASSIGNGVAAVKSNDKWTIVDSTGQPIVAETFDSVVMDEKGIVCRLDRIFVEKNGLFYMIDSAGNYITEQAFQNADVFNADGWAAVEIGGAWGFVDIDGKIKLEPQYAGAKSFSNGYAAVKTVDGWGYIDADNNLVLGGTYLDVMDFNSSGAAYVEGASGWKLIVLYKHNH